MAMHCLSPTSTVTSLLHTPALSRHMGQPNEFNPGVMRKIQLGSSGRHSSGSSTLKSSTALLSLQYSQDPFCGAVSSYDNEFHSTDLDSPRFYIKSEKIAQVPLSPWALMLRPQDPQISTFECDQEISTKIHSDVLPTPEYSVRRRLHLTTESLTDTNWTIRYKTSYNCTGSRIALISSPTLIYTYIIFTESQENEQYLVV